jgi:GT2 family glycosyltransferase
VSSISVVMTAYKRPALLKNTLASIASQTRRPNQVVVVEDGFDGGETLDVCALAKSQGLPVEYHCRRKRPNLGYSNPAIPKNIGIKRATGDILIIQCAEVMYTAPNDIENLVRPIEENSHVSTFATVSARNLQGEFQEWYAGPNRAPKWFLDFCQAARRESVMAIGGFDEEYLGYGFDDDCFALRMQTSGVQYQWALDVECYHQWHHISEKDVVLSEKGRAKYDRLLLDIQAGKRSPVVNIGNDWGNIST